jgi:hypothetical protein
MKMRIMKLTALVLWSVALLALPVRAGSLDDYYLQRFGEAPASSLKSAPATNADQTHATCGMPLKHDLRRDWDKLLPSTQFVLAKQLSAPTLDGEAILPSRNGWFRIHYATTGTDLPTPESPYTLTSWIQQVADTFEVAYSAYQGMGYKPPSVPYDVYLRSLAALRIYGQTTTIAPTPSAGFPNAYSSYIEIDKDFTDPIYTKTPVLYTPLQSLQITSAHEFHHGVQFGYNVFFDIWYAEATSTWYEGELYPAVGQLYGYVPGWFTNSTRRLDLAVDANAVSTGAGYGRWIFNRYLAEVYGTGVVKSIWSNLAPLSSPDGSSDIPMLPVINASLGNGLAVDFPAFARRVYRQQDWPLTNDKTDPHLRYVPRATYSTYPVNSSSSPLPKVSLEQYSFAYYKFVPPTNLPGDVMNIHLNATQAITARAFRKDKNTLVALTEQTFSNVYPSSVAIPNVSGASEIVLLLVNTSGNSTQNANFSTDGTLLVNDPVITTPPPTTTTTPPPPVVIPSGGGGGGGCFIATAAYGSYLHPRVQVLRDFRDTRLLTNAPGRVFVALYYRLSPPLADLIARHAPLRLLARLALTPVVLAVAHPSAAGILLLAAAGFVAGRMRRRRVELAAGQTTQ